MGQPTKMSRPLRMLQTISRLFQAGEDVSFNRIQKLLQTGDDPVTIKESELFRFMREVGGSYFYNTDGKLSLRADVSVADVEELAADLTKRTVMHGERLRPRQEGGVVHAGKRGNRRRG